MRAGFEHAKRVASRRSRRALAAGILLAGCGPALAGSTPFIGEVIATGANFCPVGFFPMDGRAMTIADNQKLHTLIGTTFGGDGATYFNLPTLAPFTTVTGARVTYCIAVQGTDPTP
jgi:Phage Tail Collar Domain